MRLYVKQPQYLKLRAPSCVPLSGTVMIRHVSSPPSAESGALCENDKREQLITTSPAWHNGSTVLPSQQSREVVILYLRGYRLRADCGNLETT